MGGIKPSSTAGFGFEATLKAAVLLALLIITIIGNSLIVHVGEYKLKKVNIS